MIFLLIMHTMNEGRHEIVIVIVIYFAQKKAKPVGCGLNNILPNQALRTSVVSNVHPNDF